MHITIHMFVGWLMVIETVAVDHAHVIWRAGVGSVTFDPIRIAIVAAAVTNSDGPEIDVPRTITNPVPLFGIKIWPTPRASKSVLIPATSWAMKTAVPPNMFKFVNQEVGLEATLTANSTIVALELTLTLRTIGNNNVTVAEVAFPQLSGIRANGGKTVGELVSAGGVRGTGFRVLNPGQNLSFPRLRWYDHGYAP